MRILVTGARGKVGAATVAALHDAGHEVTASDRLTPNFERTPTVRYLQAELRDAGETFAAVRGHEVVIHASAVPDPSQNTPHAVFHNNVMSTFNVIEAAGRFDVGRVVFLSSETVTGFTYAERPFLPDYVPIDEDLPARPQDPYALSKLFGEGLMDAAVRRSDVPCISLRPSGVCWEGDYEDRLGRCVRERDDPSMTEWSYIDVYDLTDALTLAAESSRRRSGGAGRRA
jgi:UDP-glucose 4-epimerase